MTAVASIMTPQPLTAPTSMHLGEVARLLTRHHIRHTPVVDEEGALVGVVSDFDVFARGALVGEFGSVWLAYDPRDEDLTVGDIAQTVDVIAHPDDDATSALVRFSGVKQDVMVVVVDRKPVGILTEHDVVAYARAHLDPHIAASTFATRPVLSLERYASPADGLALMKKRHTRHLVVTDAEGHLFGVVSLRDLLTDRVPTGAPYDLGDSVRSRLTHHAGSDAGLADVAAQMQRLRIGCVPLVDAQRRPVAVVTRTDVIHAVAVSL